jgi:phage protein D
MSNEGKSIQVEPAPEGPLVKPKRQMTEAQLEALKKGRAKLAEKRRQTKEAEESQETKSVQSAEPVKEKPDSYGLDKDEAESDSESNASSETEQDAQEEAEERAYCTVM